MGALRFHLTSHAIRSMCPSSSREDLAQAIHHDRARPIRSWIVLLIVVLAIAVAAFYIVQRFSDRSESGFLTEGTSVGDISLIVTASGNLVPTNEVIIGSELSGLIQEVNVDTNDIVQKDQQLARLDTSKLEAQTNRSRASLLAAKARVSQAKATLLEARTALERQQELHRISGGRTPSQAALDNSLATVARAEADLESAEAAVAGAEAEVRAFERDLEKAIIRSPVNGVVLARSVEVGQTVAASFTAPTLFTIAEDLRKMDLQVNITEADVGRVAAGQRATFVVDAWPGRSYSATVNKIGLGSLKPAGQSNNQNSSSSSSQAVQGGVVNYRAELEVDNDDLSLRPGMTATVDIAIDQREGVLLVPNSALRFDPQSAADAAKPRQPERTLVQSLSPAGRRWRGSTPKAASPLDNPRVWILVDGAPKEVPVTIGISDGRNTEITGNYNFASTAGSV
jgi:HlyD family secretion protein